MNAMWICDERAGCVAVYKSDKRVNCIGDRPDNTVLFLHGFRNGDYWKVQGWKIRLALAVTAILNFLGI